MKRSFNNVSVFILMLAFIVTFHITAQNHPAILIKEGDERYTPLALNDLSIRVEVIGNLAVTTMEMTFYNDLERVLEGNLYVPLGEGQTVSRFAMEVNGQLREASVVEKAKGRQVFESIVRKQIDPGLVEWTKGNTYKARVYPIPAKGYKQILVAYEQELNDIESGFLYLLPLAFKDKVKNFSLTIEVMKQKVQPVLDSSNQLVNLRFKQWKESYIAEMSEKNYLPDKQCAVVLPKTKMYKQVSIEKQNNTLYFYVHLNPKMMKTSKKLPDSVCLIWDTSMSCESKEVEREFDLLDRYFKKIGTLKVRLVLFSNEVEKNTETYSIKKGEWKQLKKRLADIAYDGGTRLGSIDLTSYTCDEFILSTDGISNFGGSEIKLSKTPVVVINSQATAQHSSLSYIAQKTGGVYLNLMRLTTDEALTLLSSQPYSFIGAEYNTNEIKEVYPDIPTIVTKDFSISGILLKKEAKLTLDFGTAGKTLHKESISLSQSGAVSENNLISRVWVQKKIRRLDMQYEKYREEIIKLGMEYSIVTRDTSLIVLESLEDYVEHRIIPPKEMQDRYFSIIAQENSRVKKEEEEHIEEIVRKFRELEDWWNMKFSWEPPKDLDRDKKGAAEEEEYLPETDEIWGNGAEDGPTTEELYEEMERRDEIGDADEEKSKEKEEISEGESSITLTKWDPDTPYLKKLQATKDKDIYATYLSLKKDYPASSAFYLDVADYFIGKGRKELGLRILSNIAEMELENHQLLRILGHRLAQLGYYKLAACIFEEVLAMREEEPQSYRDLGLIYASDKQYQKAVDLLYKVVQKRWDERFPDIELIAIVEINNIIAGQPNVNKAMIDKRLIKSMPVDMRVILDWDADLCDMDLWVTNPNGEKCYYGNPRTYLGGHMSKDFTQGYGPEEYILKKAKPGKYLIEVNYYGNTQQVLAGATTIQVQLYLNYGRKSQIVKEITLRLKDQKEVVTVGEFEIRGKGDKIQF
jgi:tetratricopeptide (TPR) repeat protein